MSLIWLGIVERWPNVRYALQKGGPSSVAHRAEVLWSWYTGKRVAPVGIPALNLLGGPEANVALAAVVG